MLFNQIDKYNQKRWENELSILEINNIWKSSATIYSSQYGNLKHST